MISTKQRALSTSSLPRKKAARESTRRLKEVEVISLKVSDGLFTSRLAARRYPPSSLTGSSGRGTRKRKRIPSKRETNSIGRPVVGDINACFTLFP